jgi:poly-gamma-glutamate capsule biosynthesis protein CapA/YwtB (metallophosphatase superfamily)
MSTAHLLLIGDTNVNGRADPAEAFRHVRPMFHAADAIFMHLECPMTALGPDAPEPEIPHKARWKHAKPPLAAALKAVGVSAVGLASNVMHPRAAALSTVAALDAAGVPHAGAGANLAEARKPVILDVKGTKVGVLSYASVFWLYNHAANETEAGCATIKAHTGYEPDRRALEMPGAPPIVNTWPDAAELAAMEADVRMLKARADVVILSCHWGISSSHETIDYQRMIAKAAFAAGADLIIGHHPHVIQGAEIIEGKPVFYSLGNFAFDWEVMRGRHPEGLVIDVALESGRIVGVIARPVARNDANDIAPAPMDSSMGKAIAAEFMQLSAVLGTELAASAEGIVVISRTAARQAA